ncbi:MAG TPA: hypothetical protein VLM91_06215, partial [Candidatus Methylomirabilis sp.]|nr:hypothetical protein [Candidatus Methylomirabilis sp.]
AGDPAAFAGQTVRLWTQPERRHALACAGRRVATGYAPDALAGRMLGLYQELVRTRRRIACRCEPLRSGEAKT